MPQLLTKASTLLCPHGGTVSVTTSNTRTSADGARIVRASDTFTIAGCPFTVPSGSHPCVKVQWVQTAQASRVLGDQTLTDVSVGLCKAADEAVQGTVQIIFAQPRARGR
jgi:hypothetical protein